MKKTLVFAICALCACQLWGQAVPTSLEPASIRLQVDGPPPSGDLKTPVYKGVNISGVTLICKGGETLLKVEGEYESFEWNTGSTERMIRVNQAGQYEVKVRTKGGCMFTSSVNVEERPCL
jgi:hypothetical protein